MRAHPLFASLATAVYLVSDKDGPAGSWARVSSTGELRVNTRQRGEPAEWTWVMAHCLLHLGFGHTAASRRAGWTAARGCAPDAGFDQCWNLAACLAVNRFLTRLKVGTPPVDFGGPTAYDHLVAAAGGEEKCAAHFRLAGLPAEAAGIGTGGARGDLIWDGERARHSWPELFAWGLSGAVSRALDVAGGAAENLYSGRAVKTSWRRAIDWFISSYPLLGAVAAAFTLVEDADLCRHHSIRIAAISPSAAELYVNPLCAMRPAEYQFVVAHELLHAGLRHDTRSGGRDPWLWNVACDFVINGWLTEMAVGELPDGALHDPSLRGKSAEEVYDQIAADRRRYRKLATLRGVGLADVVPRALPDSGADPVGAVDLDEFYRRSLADGIDYHVAAQRGLLPAGLVQEIRALAQPPVPWEVELARWFDDYFRPVQSRRSYARASRRQSATPDIPRPGRYRPLSLLPQRTFGVVLDTSGSMGTRLLGKALGAIASYAVAHDVPAARVVFCDAAAHDAGWLEPDEIAGRVQVRGRGGTVLQPGVDLLEAARDFPRDGPVLVITDAVCDRVRIRRAHAYLVPAGAMLPFVPRGPVFRLK